MIETWMDALVAVVDGISGIEQVHAYDDIPGAILAFPTAIVMPVSGTQIYSQSGPAVAIHQVTITMYFAAGLLPEAMGKAVPFIGKLRTELAKNTRLGGLVAYCTPVPPENGPWYEGPGGLQYGDKQLTGLVFHLVVKEVETVVVT